MYIRWTAITRKGGNCDALQLEGCTTACQSFWVVLAKYVLRVRRNCHFQASGQISDTVVAISDPDFLSVTDILAINGHSFCDLDH